MRTRILSISAGLFIFFIGTAIAVAQQSGFDLDAYRSFLSSHKGQTGVELMREHAAPLFLKKADLPFSQVRYLDSVICKFGLTPDEMDLLATNGFVVTERVSGTFADIYDSIWVKDLPVLVTTDAILHAIHKSYDQILKITEEGLLYTKLDRLLSALHTTGLPSIDNLYGSIPEMHAMLTDVDVYLTVARRLLLDRDIPTYYTDNENTVTDLLALITAQQPAQYALFSETPRSVDFSQFTVRGHYEYGGYLQLYFKAMIWLGRTEFMLSKPVQQGASQQTDSDIRRQIVDAYLLLEALESGACKTTLNVIDSVITMFVGESDNVRIGHLEMLKQETGFTRPVELLDDAMLERFKTNLATKPWAGQRINSQILMSDPMNPEQIKPPSAFLLLGQRFAIDSYLFENVVFDRVVHNGVKVPRMLPSPMDALFALGNDAAAQFIQTELDRYHYAPNLSGLRFLVDSYGDDFWNTSLYNAWLNSIRALNPPTCIDSCPAFMRTAAWWQEKMNTQLASWAQLRHDNLLYAKASYTGSFSCSYPEGYVEPFPEFYGRLSRFAADAKIRFEGICGPASGYFSRFGAIMDTLRTISDKELSGTPLEERETRFIRSMFRSVDNCVPTYDGWYPNLFVDTKVNDIDFIIADVHTAPTDEAGNPVGWVMHAGTGRVNLGIVIAPSQNGGSTAYAGAMMSYHQNVTTNFKRLTDNEWWDAICRTDQPRPDWTNVYLADNKGAKRVPGPMLITQSPTSANEPATTVSSAMLHASYPNPFSPAGSTIISFTLPSGSSSATLLDVTDVTGRKVRTLVDKHIPAGTYLVKWDARDESGAAAPAGVYMLRLVTNGGTATQRVVVMK
jgi:hypothetical protein